MFRRLHECVAHKAAVVYIEPGGYYESELKITKSTIARPTHCVVGRWKKRLSKACGHAGALSGEGDGAESKEAWFLQYFEMLTTYTPLKNPCSLPRGPWSTTSSFIPEALTRVMEANGM